MTFKQFQNTARLLCNVLPHNAIEMQKILDQEVYGDELEFLLVYEKDLYINLEMQSHPVANFFSYYLVLGNEEFVSDDLDELERMLYDYCEVNTW